MLGREYTVTFENVAVTATQDLFEIVPADDKPIKIAGLYLDNVGGAGDAGDAQEELLRLVLRRGFTSSGTGGTSATPAKLGSSADSAAGFTAEVNNTGLATTGTTSDLIVFGWNVRVPLREMFPDELMPGCSQTDTSIVVRLLSTPADSISMSGTLFVVEIG